jgi:hypothetical protein
MCLVKGLTIGIKKTQRIQDFKTNQDRMAARKVLEKRNVTYTFILISHSFQLEEAEFK